MVKDQRDRVTATRHTGGPSQGERRQRPTPPPFPLQKSLAFLTDAEAVEGRALGGGPPGFFSGQSGSLALPGRGERRGTLGHLCKGVREDTQELTLTDRGPALGARYPAQSERASKDRGRGWKPVHFLSKGRGMGVGPIRTSPSGGDEEPRQEDEELGLSGSRKGEDRLAESLRDERSDPGQAVLESPGRRGSGEKSLQGARGDGRYSRSAVGGGQVGVPP